MNRLPHDHSGAQSDYHLVQLWLAGRPERTQVEYEREALKFLDALPSGLQAATVDDVVAHVKTLTGAPSTVARIVSTIRSLLSFGHKTGYLIYNVGAVIKQPAVPSKLHERILDEDEVRSVLKYASEGRDRLLIKLLYRSGARISEAVGLRWVDVGDGRVTFFGKGSKTRTVVLPKSLTDELKTLRWSTDEADSSVFKTRRGEGMTARYAQMIVRRAADAAGLEASPHWFRHAHATHSLDHGAPIHLVQQSLGHANVSTTSRYLHVHPSQGSSQYLPES